jgi:hypothetical protein
MISLAAIPAPKAQSHQQKSGGNVTDPPSLQNLESTADKFQRSRGCLLNTSTSFPLGDCGHRTKQVQPMRVVGVSAQAGFTHDVKLADPTDLFLCRKDLRTDADLLPLGLNDNEIRKLAAAFEIAVTSCADLQIAHELQGGFHLAARRRSVPLHHQ